MVAKISCWTYTEIHLHNLKMPYKKDRQTNLSLTHQLKTILSHTPHRSWLREQAALWLLCGNSGRDGHGCWGCWGGGLSWGLLPGKLCLRHVYSSTATLRPKVESSKLNIQARYICRARHLHRWWRDLSTKRKESKTESIYLNFLYLELHLVHVYLYRNNYSKNKQMITG